MNPTLSEIKKLRVVDLRARLSDLGLTTNGLKADLVNRLHTFYQEQQTEGVQHEEDYPEPPNILSSPGMGEPQGIQLQMMQQPPSMMMQPPPLAEFAQSPNEQQLHRPPMEFPQSPNERQLQPPMGFPHGHPEQQLQRPPPMDFPQGEQQLQPPMDFLGGRNEQQLQQPPMGFRQSSDELQLQPQMGFPGPGEQQVQQPPMEFPPNERQIQPPMDFSLGRSEQQLQRPPMGFPQNPDELQLDFPRLTEQQVQRPPMGFPQSPNEGQLQPPPMEMQGRNEPPFHPPPMEFQQSRNEPQLQQPHMDFPNEPRSFAPQQQLPQQSMQMPTLAPFPPPPAQFQRSEAQNVAMDQPPVAHPQPPQSTHMSQPTQPPPHTSQPSQLPNMSRPPQPPHMLLQSGQVPVTVPEQPQQPMQIPPPPTPPVPPTQQQVGEPQMEPPNLPMQLPVLSGMPPPPMPPPPMSAGVPPPVLPAEPSSLRSQSPPPKPLTEAEMMEIRQVQEREKQEREAAEAAEVDRIAREQQELIEREKQRILQQQQERIRQRQEQQRLEEERMQKALQQQKMLEEQRRQRERDEEMRHKVVQQQMLIEQQRAAEESRQQEADLLRDQQRALAEVQREEQEKVRQQQEMIIRETADQRGQQQRGNMGGMMPTPPQGGPPQSLMQSDMQRPPVSSESMERPMDRQMDRPMDRQMDRNMDRPMGRPMDRNMDRQMDRNMDRQMDRNMDRSMDRPMDRSMGPRGPRPGPMFHDQRGPSDRPPRFPQRDFRDSGPPNIRPPFRGQFDRMPPPHMLDKRPPPGLMDSGPPPFDDEEVKDIKLSQAMEKVLAFKDKRAQQIGLETEEDIEPAFLPPQENLAVQDEDADNEEEEDEEEEEEEEDDEGFVEKPAKKVQTGSQKLTKNQRRKLKKKKRKAAKRAEQEQQQEEAEVEAEVERQRQLTERKGKDKKAKEVKVEVEYVPETIEVTDPAFRQFQRIFQAFQLEEPSKPEVKTEEKDDAAKPAEKQKEKMDDDEDSDTDESSEEEDDRPKISKKKLRKLNRLSVAELKQLVTRPDVVEMHDVTARDPKLLVYLKAYRNTVGVPRHWCFKRKYLQGKRGIIKPPFELPEFIQRTGIMEMRQALQEKEEQQTMKTKMRQKVRPKMGKIDIDYDKLHDAFFRWQTKPKLTIHGDLYYEGKEFETKLKEKKPGELTEELRTALGMPTGPNADKYPPPWLIAMQRYGPPPSYPHLKIQGLNAPIPETCSFGYHAGGWGKPPVDQNGKPLYGNVFGTDADNLQEEEEEEVDTTRWGELESESEESSSEEESEEEREAGEIDETGLITPADGGLITPSGLTSIPTGMETPDMIELRKKKIEDAMEQGAETPQLYQVIQEKKTTVGAAMVGSTHVYDMPPVVGGAKKQAGAATEGVAIALDPSELDLDTEAMTAKYEEQVREQQSQLEKEDFSDMVAEHAAKQKNKRKKQTQDSGRAPKKYKEFKF